MITSPLQAVETQQWNTGLITQGRRCLTWLDHQHSLSLTLLCEDNKDVRNLDKTTTRSCSFHFRSLMTPGSFKPCWTCLSKDCPQWVQQAVDLVSWLWSDNCICICLALYSRCRSLRSPKQNQCYLGVYMFYLCRTLLDRDQIYSLTLDTIRSLVQTQRSCKFVVHKVRLKDVSLVSSSFSDFYLEQR